MADKKYEIELKIAADVAEIKKATAELNVFKDKFNTLRNQLKQGFFLNIGAGIGNQIKSIVSGALPAYAEAEKAERKLASAMESTGISVGQNLEAFKKLASQIQSITVIGDEETLGIQTLALNMGVSANKIDEVVKSAIGLSTALNMDLATATKAASAAIQGKTELLTRYIPTLSMCKTTEEKYAKVQKLSASGFAQAKAEAETLGGTLKQLSNAWGDVSEIVGESVAPVVKAAAEILKSLADTINNNKTATIYLTRGLMGLVAVLALNKLASFLKTMMAIKNTIIANTAAVIADTVATNANTAAKMKNAAASVAQAGKYTRAIESLGSATASVGALSKVSAGGMALFTAAVNPATIAIVAFVGAVSYLGYEYGQMRDAQKEAQKQLESFAAQADARSKSVIAAMREEGATSEEINKSQKNELIEIENLHRMLNIAIAEGYDTTAIKSALAEHRNIYKALSSERDEYIAIRAAKIAAYESNAVENVSVAKEKYSDTKRTDAQKLENVSAAIATKTMSIADLEKQISEAQGEQRLKLSEHYKIEVDKLIALEAQQKTLQKSIESEKKAAADKISAQEKELNAAAEKAAALQNEMSLENRILIAKRAGNDKLVKYLEDERKIAALKAQIVNAEKTQYTTAEQLKSLEADAEQRARTRVGLENAALQAEQERAKLKNAEKANEEYIWRMKIAQAKLRGDDKEVARIENAKAAKGEIDALVAGGMDRNRAENMVAKTRAAEQAAEQAQAQRNGESSAQAAGDGRNAPLRGNAPRRERRPVTSTTKKGADGKIANSFASPLDRFRQGNEQWMREKNPQTYAYMNMPNNSLLPPSPKGGGKVKNPANDAGGSAEDPQQKEIVSLLQDAKNFLEKFDSALKDIKNNTAATATKKEDK